MNGQGKTRLRSGTGRRVGGRWVWLTMVVAASLACETDLPAASPRMGTAGRLDGSGTGGCCDASTVSDAGGILPVTVGEVRDAGLACNVWLLDAPMAAPPAPGCAVDGGMDRVTDADASVDPLIVADASVGPVADATAAPLIDAGEPGLGVGFVAVRLSVRDNYACAIRASDARIVCWGDVAPGPPPDIAFSELSAGWNHACGVAREDGRVHCWANWATDNDNADEGQARVPTNAAFESIAAGGYHTCGIRRADASLQCWGAGQGFIISYPHGGQSLPPLGMFDAVSAGMVHVCAVPRGGGGATCWGKVPAYDSGQADAPTNIAFSQIYAANRGTCGVGADGQIRCWGTTIERQSPPPSGSDFLTVALEEGRGCALHGDGGRVECWGDEVWTRIHPPAGLTLTSIGVGHHHACGLRASDSRVVCWGAGTPDDTSSRWAQASPPGG